MVTAMRRGSLTAGVTMLLASSIGAAIAAPPASVAADARTAAQQEVFAAERAFAATMARRDAAAFAAFVSREAVFFGDATAHRGRAAVVAAWAGYFEGPKAPFSWEPDRVEALDSGRLALSTGLVRDADGSVIARFNSIWRLEGPHRWRVVFDKGSPVVPPPAASADAAR